MNKMVNMMFILFCVSKPHYKYFHWPKALSVTLVSREEPHTAANRLKIVRTLLFGLFCIVNFQPDKSESNRVECRTRTLSLNDHRIREWFFEMLGEFPSFSGARPHYCPDQLQSLAGPTGGVSHPFIYRPSVCLICIQFTLGVSYRNR